MADGDLEIIIRDLEPGDTVTGLSLGAPEFTPLKAYLRRNAKEFHRLSLAKTYGAYEIKAPTRVIGYITLVCGEIESVNNNAGEIVGPDFTYKHCPAVKIARLAVDRRYSKNGVGRALIQFALGIAWSEIASRVGCRFVVVDAKQSAVSYYADKCGFTLLDTEDNRAREAPIMFVDLLKAGAAS